jgi:putative transposase
MIGWAEGRKPTLVQILPGRPTQNGHVESFHGRLRDECLNAHWFTNTFIAISVFSLRI